MTTACISCGMPMESPDDFAMGDESRDYCQYCCRPDGSLQSYDEKFQSFVGFVMKIEGVDESTAEKKVREIMSELPAWKDRVP